MDLLSLALVAGLTAQELPEIRRREWFIQNVGYSLVPQRDWRAHVREEIKKTKETALAPQPAGYWTDAEEYVSGPYYAKVIREAFRDRLKNLETCELAFLESHGLFGTPPGPGKIQYLTNTIDEFYFRQAMWGIWEYDRLRSLK